MKEAFWHKLWEKDHIGFHQDQFNPLMLEYFDDWAGAHNQQVFVPLCGKSLDMHYLARHHKVIGSELSTIACEDFFTEAGISLQTTTQKRYTRFSGANIELLAGDFFALTAEDVANCPLVFDRAALIALPEVVRKDYVRHLRALFPGGTRLFLLTLEYPDGEIDGPPFTVFEDEVLQLFDGCQIEKVKTLDLPDGKFARRTFEVTWLREVAYFIEL